MHYSPSHRLRPPRSNSHNNRIKTSADSNEYSRNYILSSTRYQGNDVGDNEDIRGRHDRIRIYDITPGKDYLFTNTEIRDIMTYPNKKILVYHHRYQAFVKEDGKPLVELNASGLGETTPAKLDSWLSDHPDCQCTVKALKCRQSDIYQVDLLTGDQVKSAPGKVNHDQNLASVKVSFMKWYVNGYRELHIISHSTFKPTTVEDGEVEA